MKTCLVYLVCRNENSCFVRLFQELNTYFGVTTYPSFLMFCIDINITKTNQSVAVALAAQLQPWNFK